MVRARSPVGNDFYPRPPRGGRRALLPAGEQGAKFLSTPSARRATNSGRRSEAGAGISIHALREEGDQISAARLPARTHFYPRPPRGGRPISSPTTTFRKRFLSTPSARRATRCTQNAPRRCAISIHALREEGDRLRSLWSLVLVISIHALREEGDMGSQAREVVAEAFLSTPSARRATFPGVCYIGCA